MSDERVKRAYNASNRRAAAEATTNRICAAAERLFLAGGYARTSMRAVAQAAEVAEATVYLAFPNKPALLDGTILRAIGRSRPEPLAAILTAPDAELLDRSTASTAAIMRGAARLIAIGDSAALMDAALEPRRQRAYTGVRAGLLALASRLEAGGLLRTGIDAQRAADTLFAISNATTYLRLVDDCGLPPEEYAAWLADHARSALLAT